MAATHRRRRIQRGGEHAAQEQFDALMEFIHADRFWDLVLRCAALGALDEAARMVQLVREELKEIMSSGINHKTSDTALLELLEKLEELEEQLSTAEAAPTPAMASHTARVSRPAGMVTTPPPTRRRPGRTARRRGRRRAA